MGAWSFVQQQLSAVPFKLYSCDGPNRDSSPQIVNSVTVRHSFLRSCFALCGAIRETAEGEITLVSFGEKYWNPPLFVAISPLSCERWLQSDPNRITCHVTDSSRLTSVVWIRFYKTGLKVAKLRYSCRFLSCCSCNFVWVICFSFFFFLSFIPAFTTLHVFPTLVNN